MDGQLTDLWRLSRPELAARYLALLLQGTSGRLALFGPRRTGKTSLICREIVPLAEQAGLLPVYCDCWQDRLDPLGSINFALESAIEAIEVPTSQTRRRLQTEVKKVGAAGFSIELGSEPKGRPPESPFFKVDWLLGSLIARAKRPVFLIIDEVQGIGEHAEGERIAGALRTALTRHEKAVRVLFTGSSETQLTKMFAQARASLYQFAARVAYEPLDADFVAHVARRFTEATKRKLDDVRGLQILRLLGNQPEAYLSVVQVPLARADRSLDDGLESLLTPSGVTPWAQYWQQSTLLQKAILVATGTELQLTSEAGRHEIAQLAGETTVGHSSVQRALGALRGRGLIERSTLSSKAVYALTDPVFELWISRNGRSLLRGGPALSPPGHRKTKH
jgi:DNA-binding transcriptional ArsR family regulator